MTQRLAWAVVFVVGCGSSGPGAQDQQVCERAEKLCDIRFEPGECRSDLDEMKKELGGAYGRFATCATGAQTCGEWIGCAAGGLGVEAKRQLDGFGKGMKKMLEDHPAATDDDDALPPECKRADVLCDKDESLVRSQCRRMINDLKHDAPHRAKLTRCFESANNCFAFDRCVDDMWFELH